MIYRYNELDKYLEIALDTILCDRYSGTWSKGKFTAWTLSPATIPREICGSDNECANFWLYDAEDYLIGKGDTIQEAYDDLVNKIKQICEWAEYDEAVNPWSLSFRDNKTIELIRKFNREYKI